MVDPKNMSIDWMGVPNQGWGVCGFTSALYALYSIRGASSVPSMNNLAEMKTRTLAEIKAFIKQCEADGRQDILTDIETFTRSFGPNYANFSINTYAEKIDRLPETYTPARPMENFSLAMPPSAVVHYLRTMADFKNSFIAKQVMGPSNRIVGVAKDDDTSGLHKGLRHWVFADRNGKVYSWGKQFDSVEAAGKSQKTSYTIVYEIIPC